MDQCAQRKQRHNSYTHILHTPTFLIAMDEKSHGVVQARERKGKGKTRTSYVESPLGWDYRKEAMENGVMG
jgi:hypothetical protein